MVEHQRQLRNAGVRERREKSFGIRNNSSARKCRTPRSPEPLKAGNLPISTYNTIEPELTVLLTSIQEQGALRRPGLQ